LCKFNEAQVKRAARQRMKKGTLSPFRSHARYFSSKRMLGKSQLAGAEAGGTTITVVPVPVLPVAP
jgi:hypothetical protein